MSKVLEEVVYTKLSHDLPSNKLYLAFVITQRLIYGVSYGEKLDRRLDKIILKLLS